MRLITMAIALAMFAVACGGSGTSGGDAARFCEIMEEFVTLANDAIAGAAEGETDDIETLTARVEELVTEDNRCWPTFLDFSYSERRAMQCLCLFCDEFKD